MPKLRILSFPLTFPAFRRRRYIASALPSGSEGSSSH